MTKVPYTAQAHVTGIDDVTIESGASLPLDR